MATVWGEYQVQVPDGETAGSFKTVRDFDTFDAAYDYGAANLGGPATYHDAVNPAGTWRIVWDDCDLDA